MSNKRLSEFKKEVKELKLNDWLAFRIKKKELSFSKLSLMLGMDKSYFSNMIKKDDFTGTQLVAIGNYLDCDPFEPYRKLLNIDARTTQTEKQQAARIAELEQKLSDLEKERDWLKEVVMRK